jgi:hypothetical protein
MYRTQRLRAQCVHCGSHGDIAALRLDASGYGHICWRCEVAREIEAHTRLSAALAPRRFGATLLWQLAATIGVVAVGGIAFYVWLLMTIGKIAG